MKESHIEQYMQEFKVDRETAIEGIEEYFDNQDRQMQETYKDVINSTH